MEEDHLMPEEPIMTEEQAWAQLEETGKPVRYTDALTGQSATVWPQDEPSTPDPDGFDFPGKGASDTREDSDDEDDDSDDEDSEEDEE